MNTAARTAQSQNGQTSRQTSGESASASTLSQKNGVLSARKPSSWWRPWSPVMKRESKWYETAPDQIPPRSRTKTSATTAARTSAPAAASRSARQRRESSASSATSVGSAVSALSFTSAAAAKSAPAGRDQRIETSQSEATTSTIAS